MDACQKWLYPGKLTNVDNSKEISIGILSNTFISKLNQQEISSIEILSKVRNSIKSISNVTNSWNGQIEQIHKEGNKSNAKGQKNYNNQNDLTSYSHLETGLFDILLINYVNHSNID